MNPADASNCPGIQGKQTIVQRIPDCDFCKQVNTVDPCEAEVDGKTLAGPWAFMCDLHFAIHGVGLGTGLGQRLILRKEQ